MVIPSTRKGHAGSRDHFANSHHHGDEPQEEYYFERSAILFDSIFKYYAAGQLHRPLDVCPQEFSAELAYWKINDGLMSNCCWRGYNMSASLEELVAPKEKKIELHDRSLRSRIHQFCEGDGSLLSTLFTFGSITFVLISVIGLVLGSIHEFQTVKMELTLQVVYVC
uniref:Ion_trans domain-containing protein n=1 Tax=Caenorhabditis japonica TaxID=281687 RepID=A0A8R1HXR6_CAEJA